MGDGAEVLVGGAFTAPEVPAVVVGLIGLGGEEILHEPKDEYLPQFKARLARKQHFIARYDGQHALAIFGQGSAAFPVAYAQAQGDIHIAAGRPEPALAAYRQGRDLATELGQYSVVLDNKVRTLETRLPVEASPETAEGAS